MLAVDQVVDLEFENVLLRTCTCFEKAKCVRSELLMIFFHFSCSSNGWMDGWNVKVRKSMGGQPSIVVRVLPVFVRWALDTFLFLVYSSATDNLNWAGVPCASLLHSTLYAILENVSVNE